MSYLIFAFGAGIATTAAIELFISNWSFGKRNRIKETEHKRLTDKIERLETELKEANRLLRFHKNLRDAAEDMNVSMAQRIDCLESENERLTGYETAVRELNRSVEILEEDVPF